MEAILALVVVGLYLLFVLIVLLISVGGTVLWIWMLIDCLSNESSEGNDKIIWALVLIFTHGLCGLLYYFIRRPERKRLLGR
jgi:hypothetical protein